MSAADGGPAFPVIHQNPMNGDPLEGFEGMTMRDYFAAKAMAALIGNVSGTPFGENHKDNNRIITNVSYIMADAMLAARKGGAS